MTYLLIFNLRVVFSTCILLWQWFNGYNYYFCRSTNTNGVDFLEEKVFQPVTKFVDSLGIEDKISRIMKLYYYKLLWRSNFILNILIKRKYLSRKVLDIHKSYGYQDTEQLLKNCKDVTCKIERESNSHTPAYSIFKMFKFES